MEQEWLSIGKEYSLQCYMTKENLDILESQCDIDSFLGIDVFEDEYPEYTHRIFGLDYDTIQTDIGKEILKHIEPEYLYHIPGRVYIPSIGHLESMATRITTTTKPVMIIENGMAIIPNFSKVLTAYLNMKHKGNIFFEQLTSYRLNVTMPKPASRPTVHN